MVLEGADCRSFLQAASITQEASRPSHMVLSPRPPPGGTFLKINTRPTKTSHERSNAFLSPTHTSAGSVAMRPERRHSQESSDSYRMGNVPLQHKCRTLANARRPSPCESILLQDFASRLSHPSKSASPHPLATQQRAQTRAAASIEEPWDSSPRTGLPFPEVPARLDDCA